jgi:hypothetical protein
LKGRYDWAQTGEQDNFKMDLKVTGCKGMVYIHLVRFEVFTASSMKIGVFWYVAPDSVADIDRRFREAYCLHHQGDE